MTEKGAFWQTLRDIWQRREATGQTSKEVLQKQAYPTLESNDPRYSKIYE